MSLNTRWTTDNENFNPQDFLDPFIDRCSCEECTLDAPVVIGKGNPVNPRFMFIAEAPGYYEVKEKMPFVGKAGDILHQVLEAQQIEEDECYFTNVVMCRPPENRDPSALEIECCYDRMAAEIQSVNPAFIIALGRIAGRTLFNDFKGVRKSRGRILTTDWGYDGISTYHPAAFLYKFGETRFPDFCRDILKAQWCLDGTYTTDPPDTTVYHVGKTITVNKALERIEEAEYLAYDWETFGLYPETNEGFCLGFSDKEGEAFVFHRSTIVRHRYAILRSLNKSDAKLIAFNAAFDEGFSHRYMLPMPADYDPYLMHIALDERPQRRNLELLTYDILGIEPYESQMLEKYNTTKQSMMTDVPRREVIRYNGMDADVTLRLFHILKPSLEKKPKLMNLHTNVLLKLNRLTNWVERNGIFVDQDMLGSLKKEMSGELKQFRKEIQDVVGDEDFNPNSHQQVQEFLWDVREYPEPEIYGRKDRSADKETLEHLQDEYDDPFVDLMLDYRSEFTLFSRYIRGMTRYLHDDGRVRPSYRVDGAETGRFSAADPPIQQWPREPRMRRIFAAPEDRVIIKADYSQIEMRLAAVYGNDENLFELFRRGLDFHTAMAALSRGGFDLLSRELTEILDSPEFLQAMEAVTEGERQAAKGVSFGLLYGMGHNKLASQTGLPREEAMQFVEAYRSIMPGVQQYIKQTQADVRNKRYVETLFGRRRRFPFITEDNLDELKRQAVNMRVQGAASTMTMLAAYAIEQEIHDGDDKVIILMHDEIVIEAQRAHRQYLLEVVRNIMEDVPFDSPIPFPVDIEVGLNWADVEEV